MKPQIRHERHRRIRAQVVQQCMTLEQADTLEARSLTLSQMECTPIRERTCCAAIEYQGGRKGLLRIPTSLSYQDHALAELIPVHSSWVSNRACEEKLAGMMVFKTV